MPRTLSARFRRAHRVVVPLAAAPLLLTAARSVSHIFVGTAPLVPLLVGSSERCSQSRA